MALMAGTPRDRLPPNPVTHLMPSRSSTPVGSTPPRWAGIAWANEPAGLGWTPILGGSSAPATSAVIVRSASARRSSSDGIAARTSADERYRSGGMSCVAIGARVYARGATGAAPNGRRRYHRAMAPIDVQTSLENLKLERDAIVLYDALAAIENDPRRAGAFQRIAANERRHADVWSAKLTELGADVPPAGGPRARVRFIVLVARVFGTKAVTDLVKALEGDEEEAYDAQGTSPEVVAIAADEREHARIWDELRDGGGSAATVVAASGGRDGVAFARRAKSPAEIGAVETWHRAGGRSGTLRAIDLRGQRRTGQQPVAGHGRRRRGDAEPFIHPARRDRRPARGVVQHGRGRIHLDAEPA